MVTEKVAIVIPVLNEEAALHRLLAEIAPNFARWVIVVDNGSSLVLACTTPSSGRTSEAISAPSLSAQIRRISAGISL